LSKSTPLEEYEGKHRGTKIGILKFLAKYKLREFMKI
jgi:hypothetical protein